MSDARDLARDVARLQPGVRPSPWPGHEHFRGYAVMVLPFSSGHLLGLRVFPESDFGPYTSVWHRTPAGDWSIYNDGRSLDTTCPRWWGPALAHAELTSIETAWTGPNELRVRMEEPRLEWSMAMNAGPMTRALNRVNQALPFWTWKSAPLLRAREWMAHRLLGMGRLRFSFVTPRGQDAVVMPERILFINSSRAVLRGEDLGAPVRLDEAPCIGDVPLPTRPSFVVAQAYARIDDPEEHQRTLDSVRAAARSAHPGRSPHPSDWS